MIVFVAGIHGVGKTHLAAPLAEQLGLRHSTASQLIREERGSQSWGKDKRVSDVDGNQAALISAVTRIKAGGQSLLLDGHFVLRDENGAYMPIPESVFRALQVDAILLLECNVEVISARLMERDDHSWSVADLASLASYENSHAVRVASALGLPLRVLSAPSAAEFRGAVKSLLGN